MKKFGHFNRKARREIWKTLSEELDGDFEKGKLFRTDVLRLYSGPWELTLDTFSRGSSNSRNTFTRFRAPFVNRDDFVFKIYRSNFVYAIGKAFGLKDIEVGYPEFDKTFIIQGNDDRKLEMFFQNVDIRDILHLQTSFMMCIKEDGGWFEKKFPEGVNELYFEIAGTVGHINELYDLYDLFAISLEHLCRIGTAYTDQPPYQ